MPQSDERNPIDALMPKGDNPEYHRRKAEHQKANLEEATREALSQHSYLAKRVQTQGRNVRQNPPRAAAPTAAPVVAPPVIESSGAQEEIPAPAPAPVAPSPKENPAVGQDHPLLQKLRKDFGIQSIPTEDVTIGDMTFTLRVLDAKSVTAALRFTDTMSVTARENDINFQLAVTAFSVISINGEPLWKIFDIPLEEKERVYHSGEFYPRFDPKEPPERVRMMASVKLMDFLNSEATMDLMDTLWKFYQQKVDPKGSLAKLAEAAKTSNDEGGGNVEDIHLS